ncbi:MAG: archaeosortase/exosortase family protein [Bacteroidetes bacterium]|nr:archaeosortase/exosortase family protein [Bacteroidota bacterium]
MNLDLKNKTTRFFVWAFVLYISWYLLYVLLIKPHTSVDEKLISLLVSQTAMLLKVMGYHAYQSVEDVDMQLVGVDGANPVWVGAPCNALTLFLFFTLFIVAFPGNTKTKLWFIPMGVIIIHVVNVLRISALALISLYAPQYLEINHTYTFTIIVYGIIFLLWMWWVKISLKQNNDAEKN